MVERMRPLGLALCLAFSVGALAATQRVGEGTALVIIDMQAYFTQGTLDDSPSNPWIQQEVMNEQVRLIQLARQRRIPIVFIEYRNCGVTEPRLTQAAAGYGDVHTIVKDSRGFFDEGRAHSDVLGDFLRERGIGNLIIAGANGNFCVKASIEGSLNNGYDVVVDPQAVVDFNETPYRFPYGYTDLYTSERDGRYWETAYAPLAEWLATRTSR